MIRIRTVTTISYGNRRRYLAVTWCGKGRSGLGEGWALQWANPTPNGYSYDVPLRGWRFKTRREAIERKRGLRRLIARGWQ